MNLLNNTVVSAANREIEQAIRRLLSGRGDRAIVGKAPAGAGKSHAIISAVEAARRQRLRVAVATPTNEQAFEMVGILAKRLKKENIVFVPANGVRLPDEHKRQNVESKRARATDGDRVVVGTLNKLGDAFSRQDLKPFEVLLIDEAFQATAVHYYMVADLAPAHLLMGDSGQLAPFSTAPEADRWRGLAEDPLLTAVGVLDRNNKITAEHKLPITRRLDSRAVKVVRAFYPDLKFEAAVRDDVRRLTLAKSSGRGLEAPADAALDHARTSGWAHVELPAGAVLTADRETIAVIVSIVRRLFERSPRVRCEEHPKGRPLGQKHVAVAVSHNDQKDLLRVALEKERLDRVHVDTANKLQGRTFEVVVAWHPLAGLDETDDFHLDPGRLCVMLTRHRQACIVVGRVGDRTLVEGIPPPTPSYVGWDVNPALDGWYAHEAVFRALANHRFEVQTLHTRVRI